MDFQPQPLEPPRYQTQFNYEPINFAEPPPKKGVFNVGPPIENAVPPKSAAFNVGSVKGGELYQPPPIPDVKPPDDLSKTVYELNAKQKSLDDLRKLNRQLDRTLEAQGKALPREVEIVPDDPLDFSKKQPRNITPAEDLEEIIKIKEQQLRKPGPKIKKPGPAQVVEPPKFRTIPNPGTVPEVGPATYPPNGNPFTPPKPGRPPSPKPFPKGAFAGTAATAAIELGVRIWSGQPPGQAAFGTAGSLAGSYVGGALGAIAGPVGALAGSIVGGLIGGAIADTIFPLIFPLPESITEPETYSSRGLDNVWYKVVYVYEIDGQLYESDTYCWGRIIGFRQAIDDQSARIEICSRGRDFPIGPKPFHWEQVTTISSDASKKLNPRIKYIQQLYPDLPYSKPSPNPDPDPDPYPYPENRAFPPQPRPYPEVYPNPYPSPEPGPNTGPGPSPYPSPYPGPYQGPGNSPNPSPNPSPGPSPYPGPKPATDPNPGGNPGGDPGGNPGGDPGGDPGGNPGENPGNNNDPRPFPPLLPIPVIHPDPTLPSPSPNPTPSPSPNPDTPPMAIPDPIPVPTPQPQPQPQPQPDPPSFDSCNSDPCKKAMAQQIANNQIFWVSVQVPIVTCQQNQNGDWEAKKTAKTVRVIATKTGSDSARVLAEFEELAKANEFTCLAKNSSEQGGVLTLPERYQLNPDGHIPQIVFVFREVKKDGTLGSDYYPLTLPHPLSDKSPTDRPLPTYDKGSWEGILTLKDFSKIIVNAKTQNEAERMLDLAKKLVDPKFTEGSFQKVGQRKGQPLKEINVKLWRMDYFPTGTKKAKPQWIKFFRK